MSPVAKNFGKLNPELPCIAASVSKPEPYADRLGVNSVNTEFSFTGTHKSSKQRLGVQNSSKRRYNNKESLSMSWETNDIKRTTGSLHNRFSKPKLSGKTSLRKGGPSLSEQEPKRRRDIKVKALEAAEAAKHLAETKENECKIKKEALKPERSKMEQDNMKQLELQKKKKKGEEEKRG
ncbi:hypothetical protein ACFX1X_005809 [Malus domestica]